MTVQHAPRLRLHPEFRSAWLERRPLARDLAAVVNCPRTQLGRWMCAPKVRATPLTVRRLTLVARLIGYDGGLFR
jgi:hypothetical protein